MSTLSELISSRRKTGQSRTGSLLGSVKEKLKEKIDPRQLISQTGLITALFPSLKSYKAKPLLDATKLQTPAPVNLYRNEQVNSLEKNTSIFAKNMMYLPDIAREINVTRKNISNLVKVTSNTPAQKADMYYYKSSEMEKLYESKLKSNQPTKTVSTDGKVKKKSQFSWLKMIGLIGTAGVSLLIVDFLRDQENSIVKEVYDNLKDKIDEFSVVFSKFSEETINSFKESNKKLFETLGDSTDKFIEEIGNVFDIDSILEYVTDGTGPLKKYEEAVASYKQKLMEGISDFSIIPTAQAATLPSMFQNRPMPDAETTPSTLGPTRTYPSDGSFNLRRAIGGAESGGRYDLAYGDRLDKSGRLINTVKLEGGGTLKTPEQFSGKKLTEMTLEEVYKFQNYRSATSQNSGGLGKYGFMPSTLFGNNGRGGLVGSLGLSMNTKFSPEVQERLQDELERQQKDQRVKLNIPETPGFVYMTHYIGPGGTAEVIAAIRRGEGDQTVAKIWNRKFGTPYGIDVGENNKELTLIKAKDFERILEDRLYLKDKQLANSKKGQVVNPEIGSDASKVETLSRQVSTNEIGDRTHVFVATKKVSVPVEHNVPTTSVAVNRDLYKHWMDIQTS